MLISRTRDYLCLEYGKRFIKLQTRDTKLDVECSCWMTICRYLMLLDCILNSPEGALWQNKWFACLLYAFKRMCWREWGQTILNVYSNEYMRQTKTNVWSNANKLSKLLLRCMLIIFMRAHFLYSGEEEKH